MTHGERDVLFALIVGLETQVILLFVLVGRLWDKTFPDSDGAKREGE